MYTMRNIKLRLLHFFSNLPLGCDQIIYYSLNFNCVIHVLYINLHNKCADVGHDNKNICFLAFDLTFSSW